MSTTLDNAPATPPLSPRFPLRFFGIVFGVLFVLISAWSLATPIYSVPDEASHTVRATAAVRGELVGDGKYFQAPAYLYIPGAGSCFAGKPSVTPACVGVPAANDGSLDRLLSTAGTNSPVYYLAVGAPSLVFTGEAAIHAMRLLSAAITALLFAALATLIRCWPRARWALLLPVAALTPMTFFLGGAINPNAVEMASAGALLVSLLTVARFRPSGWLLWFASITAVVSAALVTGGRSIGLLWLFFIAVAVVACLRRADWRALIRRTATWVLLGVLALVSVAQLVWFTRPENGVKAQLVPTPGSLVDVAQATAENSFAYWRGMIGLFGTVDVPAPDVVYVIWYALLAAVVVLPIALGRGRERWLGAGLSVALFVVPVVTQVALWRQVGDVWQGRYMLAVLLLVAILGGMALDRTPTGTGSRATVSALRCVAVVIAVGQFVAFAFTLRRYAVGSMSWPAMFFTPSWLPPGGTIGLSAAVLLALIVFVVLVWRGLPRLFGSLDQNTTGLPVEPKAQLPA